MSGLVVADQRGRVLEARAPSAATHRLGYHAPDLPQVEEWDAAAAFRLGYAANVVAYRCVQLRARAAASVPLVAGRRMGDATTINESAAITRLLGPPPGGPAPKLSATKLLRWTFAQQIVTGRRAWEIETDSRGVPVAFWPLAAAHLAATPSSGGTEWFRVFTYGKGAQAVRFSPEEVFYGWAPGGTDFRQAESELQAARFDLSLVTLCDRHSLGFLRNNAVPAAIITTTAFPTDEARRKFLRNWQAEFAGADNAGRVALNEVGDDGDGPVGDSIDVKVLGLSAKDSRLLEQRRELTREIVIALGTPFSKLDASGRTYANAEVEDRDWWENTILPDLLDLQDDLNMQLAPRLGSDVCWFDLRAVRALQRRAQPVSQTVGAPLLVQARLMTINEARADYGLAAVPDGDRFMSVAEIAALRNGPADLAALAPMLATVTDSADTATPDPTPDPTGDPAGGQRSAAPDPDPQPDPGPDLPPAARAWPIDPDELEVRRTKIWRTADTAVRTLEARWQRAFQRLFDRQAEAAVSRLTGKRGRQALTRAVSDPADPIDVETIFAMQFWVDETAQLATDLFEDTVTAAVQRLALTFEIDFDLEARWVRDFIDARANQLAGGVTQTTYTGIQAALQEGVTAGESIDQLADRIRGLFDQTYASRAETVARTEVISAYNGSTVLTGEQLPDDVVAGQEWIATRDGRTRSAHAAVDGQVVGRGQTFSVGGDAMAYPGDPAGAARNTVNCRCAVALLTPDEFVEATGQAPLQVDAAVARAALHLVATGDTEFDPRRFRRALEGSAA